MGDKYKNLFSTKSVYEIEKHLYDNGSKGFSLMMKAAFAAYEHINLNTVGKVIILCGKGNNGGDGFGLAALLFLAGRIVEIYKVEEPTKKEAKSALKLCLKLGVKLTKYSKPLKEADIYVDALLGAGIQKSQPEFVEALNNLGYMLTCMEKYEEAKNVLMQAIRINPKNADIYFNLGTIYSRKNLRKVAIEYFLKALKFDPKNADIYYNLSINFSELGSLIKAAENFKACLEIDPNNQSAFHLYNSLQGSKTKTAPREFIIKLFDYYAKNFEKSLINGLEYKIPSKIKNLLLENSVESLGSILDMGCGTGLIGLELEKYCNYLEGIDLSIKMIEEAKQKKVYDKLIQTEIIDYLTNNTLNFDYFIAADVFVYIGDLYEVFSLIKKRNKKSGDLVFSIELTTADDYMLEKSGRYSHSTKYIISLCDEFGFDVTNFKKLPIRKENKQNIPGALYRLRF